MTDQSSPTRSLSAPPTLRERIPGQNLVGMIRDPLRVLMQAHQMGEVVRINTGGEGTYLLSNPEDIRDVLVKNHRLFVKSVFVQRMRNMLGDGLLTSEGELHLRQRRLIQPAFHRQRVAEYARLMTETAQLTSEGWRGGETRDMHTEMMRLTMIVVGQALFGANVETEAPEIGKAISAMLHTSNRMLLPFWNQIKTMPLPGNREAIQGAMLLESTIRKMIAERKAAEEQGEKAQSTDLMAMLLNARDEGDGQGMSEDLVRDEVLTLFLAGHETTANALTWTWYLLSQNPEAEAKLHAELAEVLGGRTPEAEDVDRLTYTRMVLSESMRLYPPAWTIGRQAVDEYAVQKYRLPAGSVVVMSQWVTHHDPRFYPDPWKFEPERWSPDQAAARPRFAYFPFGGGPRVCVGEPFAWMEGILILAALAQCWRPRLDPAQKIGLLPQITLRPRYGMRMILEPRL